MIGKPLRCVAYQESGLWVAVCLDLSLGAQADTFNQAKKKLESQIKDYIIDACNEPDAVRRKLLRRPAPLGMWLKYYFAVFIRKLSNKKAQSGLRTYEKDSNAYCQHAHA